MTANRSAGALVACLLALPLSSARALPHPDHHEFDATLHAQYQGAAGAAREALLEFSFPDADALLVAAWRVEVLDSRGARLRTLYGETALQRGFGRQTVAWDGKDGRGGPAAAGFYQFRLTARPIPLTQILARSGTPATARVEQFLASGDDQVTDLADLRAGSPAAPKVLPFRALAQGTSSGGAAARFSRSGRTAATALSAAPAIGSLPYTVYLGNLHSQTNHSDGGGAVATCISAENPWAGQFGPTDAWEMMRSQAQGDFLIASEHNHMYDGSTGTNTSGDPAHAHDLFNGGLQSAADYTAAHPGFLALYGTEWGVISGGGHMNILNPDGLASWESTSPGNVLFGDVFVQKSDYAAIYATMKARGWVGMFNHPATTAFAINSVPLAYDANGDEVMALCEINNTNAFSHSLDETETSHPNYEIAYQKLLESGYHVAPTTDQDNHCANWGLSYTNRTGILIPNGTPLTKESFLAAVKARHVFATMDKRSQIILTTGIGGGGALMGDRITNAGALTLNVNWASTGTHTVSRVQIMEGVPGRNGNVTALSDGLTTLTLTPSSGNHFYYAVITEENGDKLWSAPIWVGQNAGAVSANITAPAADQTIATGATVSFAGAATTVNSAIVSTSWDFGDGATASGLTASHTYLNPGATPITRLATFSATDDLGSTGAATRSITVLPDPTLNSPPTISTIATQTLVKNGSGTVSFTVNDVQTAASLLDVSAASSDAVLFPADGLVLGGSGSARTLTLTPALNRTGSANITVTVVDGGGAIASRIFGVTVVSGGQPVLIISQYYEGTSNNKWLELTNVGSAAYTPPPVLNGPGQLYIGTWFNPGATPQGTNFSVNPITQTIAPGATVLFRNTSAVLPVAANVTGGAAAVAIAGAMQFNGDDITFITPVNSTTISSYNARLDSIGINLASWTAAGAGGGTQTGGMDRSFVRNSNIVSQSVDYVPAQWTLFALNLVDTAAANTTQRLGEHVFNHAPSIGDIANLTIYSGDSTGPIPFTVGDVETPLVLTLAAGSSNETLLPASAIVLGGSGTSRTVTATPVADQTGSAAITLVATDAGGRSVATSFLVTVVPSVVTGLTVTPASAFLHLGAQQQFTAALTGHGGFSTAVHWTATGGTIDANGLYSPPLSGGPYTVTATSLQDPAFAASAAVSVNHAPAVSDATADTDEDTEVSLTLQASDADSDPLTYTITTAPAHGALSGTGSLRIYTPAHDYNGPDGFTFTATDGLSDPVSGHVSISVHAVNDAPVAANQSLTTPEDTSLPITLGGSDVESDPLTFTVKTLPVHGALLGVAPDLTYLPQTNFNGSDSFTFVANDGALDSATATVTLTVTPVNDAPVASAQSARTLEDTPLAITLVAMDVDSAALTYQIVTAPQHGSLSDGTGPQRTYTPDANYNGSDEFTFKANDGLLDSAVATVSLTVDPVNDAPVATSQSLTTPEDTSLPITLSGSDVDKDDLSFIVKTLPVHGALLGVAPDLTYLPAANFNGGDSFTFVANDGALDSAPATVTLAVTAVNDAPVASAQSARTLEDTPLAITLVAMDVDSAALTYQVVTAPQHGSLSDGTGPQRTYTPDRNYYGPDEFTFKANDGLLDSAVAKVSLTVDPVNDAPVAVSQALTTAEDTSLSITLGGSDVESDALTFTLKTLPAHGTLLGVAPNLSYVPQTNFNGSDSFTFVANDGALDSAVATVLLEVTPVNDVPVAAAQSVRTLEDTAVAITLHADDVETLVLAYRVVTLPTHGVLSGVGQQRTYTPDPDWNGVDHFTFAASDGQLESVPATVTVTVDPVDDAPVAADQQLTTPEETALTVMLSATDVESDALTFSLVAPPLHGTLSGIPPNLTYLPDHDWNGTDAFTFLANDGTLDSAAATVTVVTTPVNDAPVAAGQSVRTAEDIAVAITLHASDVDSAALSYRIVTAPAHGVLSGTGPVRTYTPSPDWNGVDQFTFVANDGQLDSQPATVVVTVNPVDDAPVAAPQTVRTHVGWPVLVHLTATDKEGDALRFRIVTQPAHGFLVGIGAWYIYFPARGFFGMDSFRFVANDGVLDSAPATVSIEVLRGKPQDRD